MFLSLFSAEAVIKVVALGLVMAPHTYLRDGWNWLDIVVVALGWLEYVLDGNYSAIRSVRVLRPLRTITKIKKMRVRVRVWVAAGTRASAACSRVGAVQIAE